MKWIKRGVIWHPDGTLPWARSHATCPTPLWRPDGTLRLYLQSRDANNVGRIGWIDVDPEHPWKVVGQAAHPVLDVGAPGAFDDNGVFPTCVLPLADGRLFMYYVGFELCHHIRYRLLTGLAISEDGGDHFERLRGTPILERSPNEPHIRGGPYVLQENLRFRMWYVAGGTWEQIEGKSMPCYDIRHIESADGIHWPEEGQVVLAINPAQEHGFGRPFVAAGPEGLRMHYSVRRRNPARYRLGLAHSADGLHWQRDDDALGLDVTPGSWDGDSIEYGAPVQIGGTNWLFYNGNDFGGTGVGLAEQLEP